MSDKNNGLKVRAADVADGCHIEFDSPEQNRAGGGVVWSHGPGVGTWWVIPDGEREAIVVRIREITRVK